MRISWRKQPRVMYDSRGAILRVDGFDVGRVLSAGRGTAQWFWYAGGPDVPLENSSLRPVDSIEAAKAECERYVRDAIEAYAARKDGE